jgi:hypothetical protein
MLGLGAAAAPAVVSQYASEAVSSSPIPSLGYNPSTGNYIDKVYDSDIHESPLERVKSVREHLNHLSDKKKWIDNYVTRELQEMIRYGNYNNSIDPDIMAMKSFSTSTKIRMHIQRRAERRYNDDYLEISENLKYWMKKAGL